MGKQKAVAAPAPIAAPPEEVDVMAQKKQTRDRLRERDGRASTMLQSSAAPVVAKKTVLG